VFQEIGTRAVAGKDDGSNGQVLKNADPLVSVIIPAFACAEYIGQTLQSVFEQSLCDYEIIVVNDGSPDTELLESILQPYRDKISYIKQATRGPAGARNTGIRAARGRYLAFLDSDDYWAPDHLQKQLALFREDGSLDLVYCDSVLVKNEKPLTRAFMIQPQKASVDFDSLLVESCAVATSTTVVSRDAIIRAGYFDESLKRCEDFEMWLRLAFTGARMAYHSDAQVFHRLRDTGLSADRWSMRRDRIRVYQKVAALPISPAQKKTVDDLIAQVNTDCQIDLIKHFLDRREYSEALKAARRANERRNSWKIRLTCLGLQLAPDLLRQLFRARAWVLRHPPDAMTTYLEKTSVEQEH
jgi:glycosyltransferase involved in cell wall biosynthesis